MNVNGQRTKWKDKVKYLGNILTKHMCDDADIRAKRGEFIGSVNRLNVQFCVVPDQIRIPLLQTIVLLGMGVRHGSSIQIT